MPAMPPDRAPAASARHVARLLLVALAGIWLALQSAQAAVGFQVFTIPDGSNPPLEIGIWYPSDVQATPHRLGLHMQTVALGGALAGTGLPLVLMSHGSGGWFGGHLDTAQALAEAGFVVAAVTHTGDNVRDQSRVVQVEDRPHHIIRMLDYLLADWPDHARLDPARIGAFGFSAGGFTVLVLAGGTPDLGRVGPHCVANPDEWTCRLLRERGVDAAAPPPPSLPASAWAHDPRIRAAVVAAPALGFAFGRAGLAGVHVPIQLWRAERDQILPHPWYADAVAADLPTPPEYHVIPDAGHFVFLAPCPAEMAEKVPEICRDPDGVDRSTVHGVFNTEVVRFFTRTLAPQ